MELFIVKFGLGILSNQCFPCKLYDIEIRSDRCRHIYDEFMPSFIKIASKLSD